MRPPKSLVPGAWSGFGARLDVRQPWGAAGPARRRCAPASPSAPRPAPAPGTLPAPGARTHRSRSPAAEPGSGDSCGCRMPSGPSATRRPGAGVRPGAGSGGGHGGRAAARLLSSGLCGKPGARGKFGWARGGAEGAEGPRPRPAPPCPRRPAVPTGERPPPARRRAVRRGAPADAILPGLVPRSVAGLEEETAPTKGGRAPTGLTEPYLGARY